MWQDRILRDLCRLLCDGWIAVAGSTLAAQMQLPRRGFLNEYAELRIAAERKKRWAEYRLAKETASGKSMRRQLRRIVGQSSTARRPIQIVTLGS
jgi:hypothetical protein